MATSVWKTVLQPPDLQDTVLLGNTITLIGIKSLDNLPLLSQMWELGTDTETVKYIDCKSLEIVKDTGIISANAYMLTIILLNGSMGATEVLEKSIAPLLSFLSHFRILGVTKVFVHSSSKCLLITYLTPRYCPVSIQEYEIDLRTV